MEKDNRMLFQHCQEHEDRTICIAQCATKVNKLEEENTLIWKEFKTIRDELRGKLSKGAFRWLMGTIIGMLLTILGTQGYALWSIQDNVSDIAVEVAKMSKDDNN